LTNTGNVVISGDDAAGNGAQWTFDTTGNLTLPGAAAGETIATSDGYITVGNLLIGQGGALFNLNNDSWALFGNRSDPGTSITIPSNDSAFNGQPLTIENQISNVGIVSGLNTWNFDTTGNLTVPGNINFGGDASAGPSLNDFASVTSAANFAVTIDSADSAPTWSFETGDATLAEFDGLPVLRTPLANSSVIHNETQMVVLAGNIDAGWLSSVTVQEDEVLLLARGDLGGDLATTIFSLNLGGVGIRDLGEGQARLSVTGNITGGNILTAGSISSTGNVTGGNINTAGVVSATGDLTANNVSTGNVTATRLQNDANLEIRSNVAGTARIWTFDTIGDFNLPVGGNISGSGYVTAIRLITDPRPLANLSPVSGGRAFVSDGNLVAVGNFGVQIGGGGANTVPVWSDGANWYVG
jgi:hypothetical protein